MLIRRNGELLEHLDIIDCLGINNCLGWILFLESTSVRSLSEPLVIQVPSVVDLIFRNSDANFSQVHEGRAVSCIVQKCAKLFVAEIVPLLSLSVKGLLLNAYRSQVIDFQHLSRFFPSSVWVLILIFNFYQKALVLILKWNEFVSGVYLLFQKWEHLRVLVK